MQTTLTRLLLIAVGTLLSLTAFSQVRFEFDFDTTAVPDQVAGINGRFAEINGKQYFSHNDGFFGLELWSFDPATEQCSRLTDIKTASGNSNPEYLTAYAGEIYFTANDNNGRWHIYRYNPANGAVRQVTDLNDSAINGLTVHAGKLWYGASYENRYNLWSYDAATGVATEYLPPSGALEERFAPRGIQEFNGKLVLSGTSGSIGVRLWMFDATTGTYEGLPTQFDAPGGEDLTVLHDALNCNGQLLLRLTVDIYQERWYRYDASLDSCIQLVNMNSTNNRGFDRVVFNNQFWFVASSKLWRYDPTTHIVTNISQLMPSPVPTNVNWLKLHNQQLYFRGNTVNNLNATFRYTPSLNLVERLAYFDYSPPNIMTLIPASAHFYAFSSATNTSGIFKYFPDGSPAQRLHKINQQTRNSDYLTNMVAYDGRIFFNNFPTAPMFKDTASGEFLPFSSLFPQNQGSIHRLYSMANINDRLYFSSQQTPQGQFRNLVSFKTGEDTLRWHRTFPNGNTPGADLSITDLQAHDQQLYFTAYTDEFAAQDNKLFVHDVVKDSTYLLSQTAHLTNYRWLQQHGSYLGFTAHDSANIFGTERYFVYDIPAQTLQEVPLPVEFSTSYYSDEMFIAGNRMFIYRVTIDTIVRIETLVWNILTNSLEMLVNPPGITEFFPTFYTEMDGQLWFTSWVNYDVPHALYKLDPVSLTPEKVIEFTHFYDQILPGPLTNFGGKIYFGAHQYPLGHELYAYDPATGLLELIADINTGGGSSNPASFHLIGDRLYFMANDEQHGRELWSLGNCFSLNMDIVPAAAGQANGQIELLTNGGALPYTFNWSNGATTSSLTGLAAGFYEVTVQDASGCSARRFVVLGETVGVQDHAPELGLKAFPNPVSGHALLHVSLDNPYTGLLQFELWSQDGQLMRKMNAEKTDTSFQAALYVDHLPAGVYFLRVQDGHRMAVKKIIVTD